MKICDDGMVLNWHTFDCPKQDNLQCQLYIYIYHFYR